MANTPQALKRAKQAKKHREHNLSFRSMTRTHLKKVKKAIESGNHQVAQEAYKKTVSTLDKMVSKGYIHKNKAARHKSRLIVRIKTLAGLKSEA